MTANHSFLTPFIAPLSSTQTNARKEAANTLMLMKQNRK
jgi:hypothetical protein